MIKLDLVGERIAVIIFKCLAEMKYWCELMVKIWIYV